MTMVRTTTGLPMYEVMKDFSSGNGPTIKLEDIPALREDQDPKQKTITMDIKAFIGQFNDIKNGNAEDEYYQNIANIMYIAHEYGHYGDKKTNHGVNSGQQQKYEGDLEFSSSPTTQSLIALTGHRGNDIDEQILWGQIYTEGSSTTKERFGR